MHPLSLSQHLYFPLSEQMLDCLPVAFHHTRVMYANAER